MKKVLFFVLMLTACTLVACGGSSDPGTEANVVTTLVPVPVEYAGKTNPLGADAVSSGAEVFKINFASDRQHTLARQNTAERRQ